MKDVFKNFINLLDNKGYNYKINPDNKTIVVIARRDRYVDIPITEIPENIIFECGEISMLNIQEIPKGTVFTNQNDLSLDSVEKIQDDTIFENEGDIYLYSLYPKDIPQSIQFNNKGGVSLRGISTWKSDILQLDPNDKSLDESPISGRRILNLLIRKGLLK